MHRVSAAVALLACLGQGEGFLQGTAFLGGKSLAIQPATNAARAQAVPRQRLTCVMRTSKPVLVTGNNVEVTPALMEYVNKRMENILEKLGSDVTKVDVHLVVSNNPRVAKGHVAEVTVFAKGAVIRVVEGSENMYASIDLVGDRVARKLRKFKERKVNEKRHRPSIGEVAGEAEEVFEKELTPAGSFAKGDDASAAGLGLDDLDISVDMSVVKRKSFPMPPQTVEEAVLCLEFIGHPFYVFKNSKTQQINVVYKRNSGGVGLIEPEI